MKNGNGDLSLGLVPAVPRIEEPEDPTLALQATDPSFPIDTATHSGARIFIHAPQYHWHTSGIDGIDQEARERLVALEALVNHFGRQTEQWEEQLANRMDTEGAIRAQGQAEFEEFRATWIEEIEKVQVAMQHLTERVNLQDEALKNLEIDVENLSGEIRTLGQVDEIDKKVATQKVTHLQHKIESALQDR